MLVKDTPLTADLAGVPGVALMGLSFYVCSTDSYILKHVNLAIKLQKKAWLESVHRVLRGQQQGP